MFSALMNSQNKIFSIPITAVTWKYSNSNSPTTFTSISSNTSIEYTGFTYTIVVDIITPAGASYTSSTTTDTDAGGSGASTAITGDNGYTGTFTSPTLTIIPAPISGTANSPSVTYNGLSQTETVITGVSPVGASYSGSLTITQTNAGSYTTSIIGTPPNYTGTVNGGTFTINKANLSVSGFAVQDCGGNSVARMTFTVSGFQGVDTGSLTTWIGTSSPTSIAPVSTNDNVAGNSVSQTTNANPISVSNGTPFAALYLCVNEFGFQYWVQVSGGSNYNASGFDGPVDQQCGS